MRMVNWLYHVKNVSGAGLNGRRGQDIGQDYGAILCGYAPNMAAANMGIV